jgi:hypothetical protein
MNTVPIPQPFDDLIKQQNKQAEVIKKQGLVIARLWDRVNQQDKTISMLLGITYDLDEIKKNLEV